jgi:hypothetical protein
MPRGVPKVLKTHEELQVARSRAQLKYYHKTYKKKEKKERMSISCPCGGHHLNTPNAIYKHKATQLHNNYINLTETLPELFKEFNPSLTDEEIQNKIFNFYKKEHAHTTNERFLANDKIEAILNRKIKKKLNSNIKQNDEPKNAEEKQTTE